jgi:chromate reductase, NAD(P)H dehydrogenase (quinone)
MDRPANVAVLVGSLRRDSLSRKLAHGVTRLAPNAMNFDFVGFRDLPLYNPDLEGEGVPEAWRVFRQRIRAADAVLFVTPEYNRSVPGGLKNALDVGSRPPAESVWNGKPGAVLSASPGGIGGFGANHALRESLVFLNVPTLQQPTSRCSRRCSGCASMRAGPSS